MLVATTDGRVLNGLLKKDGAEEVVLAIDATQEVRIARSEIEEMKAGEVSVMPAGLDQQLTEEQIADLVAFLKAAK
jgi:putative heme-binding domain-containing protein